MYRLKLGVEVSRCRFVSGFQGLGLRAYKGYKGLSGQGFRFRVSGFRA